MVSPIDNLIFKRVEHLDVLVRYKQESEIEFGVYKSPDEYDFKRFVLKYYIYDYDSDKPFKVCYFYMTHNFSWEEQKFMSESPYFFVERDESFEDSIGYFYVLK